MKDHWPTSSEDDRKQRQSSSSRRPKVSEITPSMPPALKPSKYTTKNTSSEEDGSEDGSDFGDAFVVRRRQPNPDGSDDAELRRSNQSHHSANNNSSVRMSDKDDGHSSSYSDDRSDANKSGNDTMTEGDDGASLADLTSYGSGVELHPHHKGRRSKEDPNVGKEPAPDRSGSRTRGGGRSSSHRREDRHRSHRETYRDDPHQSSRRRKPSSSSRREEEEYYENSSYEEGRHSSNSGRRGKDYRQLSRRSGRDPAGHGRSGGGGVSGLFNGIVRSIAGLFDGVSVKTVLLCMLGMLVVLKTNRPPSLGEEVNEVSRATFAQGGMEGSNNLRGALLEGDGENGNGFVDAGEEGEGVPQEQEDEEQMEEAAEADAEASLESEIPPPPAELPPAVQQAEGAVAQSTLQGFDPNAAAVAQQAGYAVPQPPPPQQGAYDPNAAALAAQQGYAAQGYAAQPGQPGAVGYPPQPGAPGQPIPGQVPAGYGAPAAAGSYAVGASSTYDQSPLAWQQAQQAAAAANGADGSLTQGQFLAAPGAVPVAGVDPNAVPGAAVPGAPPLDPNAAAAAAALPQPQFGAAVDPSQMQPPSDPAAAAVAVDPAAAAAAVDPAEAVVAASLEPDPLTAAVPLVPAPAPNSILELLSNFKDTWDPWEKTDIPMFWHIPKAGGSSIKDAMGGCHRFVQATEFGITDGHDQDTEVAIVYPAVPGVADTDRSPFVNIDSTTVAGIQRAKSMGFADAQLADVVVSPFVFELNDLFTQTAKGRLFTVFRHPIDRAVSMFYYIRVADWEPSYRPELQEWTLEQYAASDIVENNWMTRQLSNQLGGELTEANLKLAMEVVQTKFLVGLMSEIEPTMSRCEKFFRWTYHVNPPNQEKCRERLMSGGANSNKKNKKPVEEGDSAWNALAQQNEWDLKLYAYIEKLFEEQEVFVQGLPDNFRNVDATCCKCYPQTFPPEGFTCPEAVKNEG